MPYAAKKHRPPGWKPYVKPTDPFYSSVFWQQLRERVRRRDRGICVLCGEPGWIIDHIRSRAEGGADHEFNLRTLCADCDARRHAEKGVVWR
jgi:5-methylcytosine-specific restriction endonuclease McrA